MLTEAHQVGIITNPIFQKRNLKNREVQDYIQMAQLSSVGAGIHTVTL